MTPLWNISPAEAAAAYNLLAVELLPNAYGLETLWRYFEKLRMVRILSKISRVGEIVYVSSQVLESPYSTNINFGRVSDL